MRFTNRYSNGNPFIMNCSLQSTNGIEDAIEKLAEYEDLEEHGKLVLFPTYAYFIKDNKVYKGWVQEVIYSVCKKALYDIRYDDNSLASYRGYLGNDVFLTEKEAEKRLKKVEIDKKKLHHCVLCGEYIEREHLQVCDKCASEYEF